MVPRYVQLSFVLILMVALFNGAAVAQRSPGDNIPFGFPSDNIDSDGNDQMGSADNITANVTIHGTLYGNDDRDYFRANLTNSTPQGLFNMSIALDSADTEIMMTVWDPQGLMLLQRRALGPRVNVSVGAVLDGYHYVLLTKVKGQVEYNVTFSLDNMTMSLDGNDALPGAVSMGSAGSLFHIQGTLQEVSDYADFYKMHIESSQNYSDVAFLSLDVPAGADMAMDLYKTDAARLTLFDTGIVGEDEDHEYVALEPSTDVYVRIWLRSGNGFYNLTVDIIRGWTSANNNITNATPLAPDVEVAANLTAKVNDLDFYKVQVRGGAELTARVDQVDFNATTGKPQMDIFIYDLKDDIVTLLNASSNIGQNETLKADASADGDLYTAVRVDGFGAHGSYKLSVSLRSPPWIKVSAVDNMTIKEDEEGELDLSTVFEDSPGRTVTYRVQGNSTVGIVITGASARIFTRTKDWFGSEKVTFVATNDLSKSKSWEVNVTFRPINDAPIVHNPYMNVTIDEDTEYVSSPMFLDSRFSDVDPGDELDYSAEDNGSVAVIFTGSQMVLHPQKDWFGSVDIMIVATDQGGLFNQCIIHLMVLPLPDTPTVGDHPPMIEMTEDSNYLLNLTGIFNDVDGDVLNYSVGSGSPIVHLLFVQQGDSPGPIWLVEPVTNWFGMEMATFYAMDPTGLQTSFALTFNISPINDPPEVIFSALQGAKNYVQRDLNEDSDAVIDVASIFGDPDEDALAITWTINSSEDFQALLDGDILTIIPPQDWDGNVTLQLTARDPSQASVTTELVLFFRQVNDAPSLIDGTISPTSGDENTMFTFTVTYQDKEGDLPTVYLVVLLENGDEKHYVMGYQTGDYGTGAHFSVSAKLPAEARAFYFTANDHGRTASSFQTSPVPLSVKDVPEPYQVDPLLLLTVILVIALAIVIIQAMRVLVARKEYDYDWDEGEELGDDELDDDFWKDKGSKKGMKKHIKKGKGKKAVPVKEEEENEEDEGVEIKRKKVVKKRKR